MVDHVLEFIIVISSFIVVHIRYIIGIKYVCLEDTWLMCGPYGFNSRGLHITKQTWFSCLAVPLLVWCIKSVELLIFIQRITIVHSTFNAWLSTPLSQKMNGIHKDFITIEPYYASIHLLWSFLTNKRTLVAYCKHV